jgi:hypothetical protein
MLVDILMLIYSAIGAYRGRRKEISLMLYRLIRNSVAITTGAGLYKIIGNSASHLLGKYFSDSLGFFLACIVPIFDLRLFKQTLRLFIDARIQSNSKIIATCAGFSGNFILSGVVVVTFFLSHAERVQAFILKHSAIMRVITSLFN